jgi:4-diphosphocytidyl-2-C-methyl-D-erythritol kinase
VLENSLLNVPDADNLILKAAFLLKKETNCSLGAKIKIEKNLPMGGGIGGGSSDAATTLVVLNHLWQLSLSQQKLMDIGLSLGADIPIFIFGKTAWAEGVGEKFSQINVIEQWVLILKPDCHVNTKEIFSASDLTRNSKSLKIEDFDVRQIKNDCLEVVCKRYEPVKHALDDLNAFADARLTGTGACVFALFDSESSARNAQRELGSKWQTYLTKSCNQSPLFS